uniref:Transglycosylase-associated protein n=1 Tax=Solibacter usitatus (strain Ellin6076) TaxID=234267 RepID=Q01WY3_SOLUE
MMTMIGHAFMGLIVGLVARAILPGRQHMGLILTMLLGMVGAWLGGVIGRVTGMYEEGKPAGFVMAVAGALVVLLIYVFATRSGTAILLPLTY